MTGRNATVSLALTVAAAVLAAPAVADDKARVREGGSSGARSSAAGERHHTPPPRAESAPSGGSSFNRGGSSHAAAAPLTDAQRRHPRAGTGTGWRRHGGTRVIGGYGYSPYYNRYSYGYGRSYGFWGYSPYYYSGFYGYSPYDYRYSRYGYGAGALRVLVDPEKTRVYVDGYYAGIADDFDGLFQRLHIGPGRHDISLRLDGYRTQRFKVYIGPGQTLKLHHDMVRGSGESDDEVLGGPEDYARFEDDDSDSEDRDDDADRADRGTLRLDVRPGDASVYVNGAFRGAARELRSLRLPAGRHRVEVVRPGYRTEEREVEVRPGESTSLSVELERS